MLYSTVAALGVCHMNTFSVSYLRKILIERKAFIYHGASFAKGIGNSSTNALSYLDRLRNVMTQDLEICCSTIKFGDSELNRDFWGRMGLILWPKSHNSITLVSPTDAGTVPDLSIVGRRQINRLPITSCALVNSIDHRPPHTANEWCVLDYAVIGIFVEPPIQYVENGDLHGIELKDVFQFFPSLKVFAFCHGQLRELLPPGIWGSLVSISELYPYDDKA